MTAKRELLLATAEALFIQHGIRRVTVEEICRKAGISKATFYKHFGDRTRLALAVLDAIISRLNARFAAIVESDRPYPEQLALVMELDRSSSQELGPALIEDLMDPEQTELQAWIREQEEKSRDRFLGFLRRGQEAGVLNRHFPPAFFLYLFALGREIYQDPRFRALSPDVLERGAWLYEFMMYGLMAPPPETPQE